MIDNYVAISWPKASQLAPSICFRSSHHDMRQNDLFFDEKILTISLAGKTIYCKFVPTNCV